MDYDVVLLLCGGGLEIGGSVQPDVQKRLDDFLAHEGSADSTPVIIAGGYAYKTNARPSISEAAAYLNYLRAKGWRHEKVILEEESPDTVGNVIYTKIHILIPQKYKKLLVLPSPNHSMERVSYILHKILGPSYSWHIRQFEPNLNPENIDREKRSLALITEFGNQIADGDHQAILNKLTEIHPAYGINTTYSLDDLKRRLS